MQEPQLPLFLRPLTSPIVVRARTARRHVRHRIKRWLWCSTVAACDAEAASSAS
jgi:hypothetical protein